MPPRPLAQKAAAQDEDRSDQYRDEGQQTMLSTQRQPHPDAEEQVDELLGSLDGSSETNDGQGPHQTQGKRQRGFDDEDDHHGNHGEHRKDIREVLSIRHGDTTSLVQLSNADRKYASD